MQRNKILGIGQLFNFIPFLGLRVIVTGPLFSLSASGQLGKSLVYSEWNGRKYVREYVVPTNPNSLAQIFQRQFFGAISKWWSVIAPTERLTWQSLADAGEYSTFNAYCAANLDLETAGQYPEATADHTGIPVGGTMTAVTAVGGINRIDGTFATNADTVEQDLIIMTLSTDGGANGSSETIQRTVFSKIPISGIENGNYSVTHVPPGSWRIGAIIIGQDGSQNGYVHPAGAVTVTGS